MNNRRFAFFSSVFLIAGAFGCQAILGIDDTTLSPSNDAGDSDGSTTDGSPTDGATGDAPSGDAASNTTILTFAPARLFLRQGSTVDVAVTITRNGFTGPVTLTLASVADAGVTPSGGPDASGASGIGVPTLTIPAGSNTGTLHVTAGTAAPEGLTALDFTMSADKISTPSLVTLVAGAPGTLDQSFGTLGVVADLLTGQANALAIAPDDSMYVAGVTASHWVVRHYFADGSADAPFNTAISATLDGVGGSPSRIAVRGSALVVGGSNASGQLEIRKFSTAGSIDATFAVGGTYNLQRGGGGFYNGYVTGLAFSSAGDVLATGINTETATAAAYRFHGSAHEDRYLYGASVTPAGVRLDPTGKTIVGGTTSLPDAGANWFAQTIDTTWNDGGTQTSGSPSLGIEAANMTVSPTGELAIAGEGQLVNGVLATFDTATLAPGLLLNAPHGGTSDNGFDGVAVQSDAKLVLCGNAGGSMTNCFVRRYEPDGGIDTSFANNGNFIIFETNFGPETHFYDVAVDSWDRIVVVGVSNAANVGFYVTRLWP